MTRPHRHGWRSPGDGWPGGTGSDVLHHRRRQVRAAFRREYQSRPSLALATCPLSVDGGSLRSAAHRCANSASLRRRSRLCPSVTWSRPAWPALPWAPADHVDADLTEVAGMDGHLIRVFAANRHIDDQQAAERLSTFLDRAAARNIRVVVALIDFYRSGFYPQGLDGYYTDTYNGIELLNHAFFESGYKDRYLDFVQTVVATNKDKPNVFAWEYGNELKDERSPQTLISFMNHVGEIIRSIDPDTAISTGMMRATHTALTPADLYPNLAYVDLVSVHAYSGDRSGTADIDWARANGRRVFVGELGIPGTGDRSGAVRTEVDYWKGRGAEALLQWGFMAKGLYDNGNGDRIYGMDTIWHTDYDLLAVVYQQAATNGGAPTPLPTSTATTSPTATATSTPVPMSTPTPTDTPMPISTPTDAPTTGTTSAPTASGSATPVPTATPSPTATATSTPVAMSTTTPTDTPRDLRR
jgi:hypothetical protein